MLEYLFGSSDQNECIDCNNEATVILEYLIQEMQKKGNNIIIDKNGKTETYFYAAQRLKLAKTLNSSDPCKKLSKQLLDRLIVIAKFCPAVATKPSLQVREDISYIADYLSEHVLVPVPEIDAFLKLLTMMEAKGNAVLVELSRLEKIKKTYRDAAYDLKSFTSAKDPIRRSDSMISNIIRTNLKKLVTDVCNPDAVSEGYELAVMNQIINEQTQLLTSFILLQREKTAALEELVDHLENQGDATILLHGNARRSCRDAMYLLYGVTADHLRNLPKPNPIISKKLEVKLNDLFKEFRRADRPIMNAVVEEASNYLAYRFTEPVLMKTCHCASATYKECDKEELGNQRNAVRELCRCAQLERPGPSDRPEFGIAECPVMAFKTKDGAPPPCPAQDEEKPCPGN